ncbi:MAG: hypothetical protein LBJ08_11845 [Bifidobacteriaceae bacterium]|jgi:hypothetical protein|nr:hypothetical protein [Bifidobacteriaceae bacterium]
MLRFALAQMRRQAGRLVAAATAIVISTAFISAAVMGMAAIRQGVATVAASGFGNASLIAQAPK